MKLIRNIIEPDHLLVYWNTLVGKDHMKRCIAKIFKKDDILNLTYLTDTDDYKEAIKLGFWGFPGLRINTQNHKNVEEQFYKRVVSKKRDDFKDFLKANRILPETKISDFALLGYSGGRLVGDNFVIVHPFDTPKRPFQIYIEVAGFRFRDNNLVNIIDVGLSVNFEYESDNQRDEDAIKILFNNHHLGYVGRGLIPSFRNWLETGSIANATIERINGTKEKPRLYIFLEIE